MRQHRCCHHMGPQSKVQFVGDFSVGRGLGRWARRPLSCTRARGCHLSTALPTPSISHANGPATRSAIPTNPRGRWKRVQEQLRRASCLPCHSSTIVANSSRSPIETQLLPDQSVLDVISFPSSLVSGEASTVRPSHIVNSRFRRVRYPIRNRAAPRLG